MEMPVISVNFGLTCIGKHDVRNLDRALLEGAKVGKTLEVILGAQKLPTYHVAICCVFPAFRGPKQQRGENLMLSAASKTPRRLLHASA